MATKVDRSKGCVKCGSTAEPRALYRASFLAPLVVPFPTPPVPGSCVSGVCPNGEHLHLTCGCGYQGIAPCRGSNELGDPYRPEPVAGVTHAETPSWWERLVSAWMGPTT